MNQPHPLTFTFIGQYLNKLIDQGEVIEVNLINEKIRNNILFEWLKKEFGVNSFITTIPKTDLDKAEFFFRHLANTTISENNFGTSKNGLCILVSYCFEACQTKSEDMNYTF